jgi:hypothetical protein
MDRGLKLSVKGPVHFISSKSRVYSLKDRDPVGLSPSRSAGFSNWTVLMGMGMGRTAFDTISSIPDPTLSLKCEPDIMMLAETFTACRVTRWHTTEHTRSQSAEPCRAQAQHAPHHEREVAPCDAPLRMRLVVAAPVEFESNIRRRSIISYFQALSSRRFQRRYNRVNLHRLTSSMTTKWMFVQKALVNFLGVELGRHCPQRHPTHIEPYLFTIIGIL